MPRGDSRTHAKKPCPVRPVDETASKINPQRRRGHCQVDEKRALRSLDALVSIIVQETHVTASQTQNDRVLSNRW